MVCVCDRKVVNLGMSEGEEREEMERTWRRVRFGVGIGNGVCCRGQEPRDTRQAFE